MVDSTEIGKYNVYARAHAWSGWWGWCWTSSWSEFVIVITTNTPADTHTHTHTYPARAGRPVSLTIFRPKLQFGGNFASDCNSVAGHQIATNVCTYHDSTAVVPCTKFCSEHCMRVEVRVKRNFHWICIAMEKTSVIWTLEGLCPRLYI